MEIETIYGVAILLWIDDMISGPVYVTTLGRFSANEVSF